MREKTAISALFLDLDRALNPIEVSREKTQVTHQVQKVYRKTAKAIPVTLTVTKDMRLVQRRFHPLALRERY